MVNGTDSLVRPKSKDAGAMDKSDQDTHSVVTMTQFQSNSGYTPLAQVEAYWEALRGARLMPNRAEINPRGIEQALEFTFIVERIAPGIARLRIAGSHLSDLMGMEVRGMPLTSFMNASSRRQVSDILEEVFETPATCTLHLSSDRGPGMPALEARMLLMPLKSDLGDVSRILGVLVALGDLGRSPRRFDVQSSKLRPILTGVSPSTHRAVLHKPKVSAPQPLAKAGFSEPKTPFVARGRETGVPYLRLVKSDD
jgi:hypothetical protein